MESNNLLTGLKPLFKELNPKNKSQNKIPSLRLHLIKSKK